MYDYFLSMDTRGQLNNDGTKNKQTERSIFKSMGHTPQIGLILTKPELVFVLVKVSKFHFLSFLSS